MVGEVCEQEGGGVGGWGGCNLVSLEEICRLNLGDNIIIKTGLKLEAKNKILLPLSVKFMSR